MNAIDLLIQDHEKLKKLLEQISSTTERAAKTRTDVLAQIEAEVLSHTRIEEDIFYPAYRDASDKEGIKMFHEAVEEHRAVSELVLPDLLKTQPDTMQFSGRIKVLKELLEHHIEEEESEMFPHAREVLKDDELNDLGKEMEAMKKTIKADIKK
ncbi:hemerythrin domain-containing protein [Pseudomonas sp. gcc21]|uniref:hemerythrin domain-containing protein n=1 Tax=Pseudomonas sp. gcc21 TaxID=2726989 RepID=UPI0014514D56|nr:hemerythrin domain-containing protein [Pseudomonas sp. gcc21]QJD57540.1 hemerythrin domain-containing protein [Pseudomonas sp. gcc21]